MQGGLEVSAGDLAQGGRLGGAADEDDDRRALREAGFGDGQAPAATGPFRGDEAGAGRAADERALRPERSDMAVVAETEDAQIEGLGGRAGGPGGLVGGRGFDRRQLHRPSETARGGHAERIEHAAGGVTEVGVIR